MKAPQVEAVWQGQLSQPVSGSFSSARVLRPPRPFEAETEQAFVQDYASKLAQPRRLAALLATLMWTLFVGLDLVWMARDPVYAARGPLIIGLRLLTTVLLMLLISRLWSPRFGKDAKFANRVLSSGVMLGFFSSCVLAFLAPAPYDERFFFTGMLAATLASFALFGLPCRLAQRLAACYALCSGLTVLSCDYLKPRGPGLGAADEHFVLAFALCMSTVLLVGIFVSWCLEVFARGSFRLREELARQHRAFVLQERELARLNKALARSGRKAQGRMQAVLNLKERLGQEAERRSAEKSRFIASAVHDLRQPVQALLSAQRPLEQAILQAQHQQARDLLRLTRQATQALHEQLRSILDISHLESGQVQASLQPLDLGLLLQQLQEAWQRQAADAELDLLLSLPPGGAALRVHSDAEFLRRILDNLVSNGIKYRRSPAAAEGRGEPARLRLSAWREGAEIHLAVADNGVGMAPALVDEGMIFRPFFQGGKHPVLGGRGVGLGLTIVKALLQLLPAHRLAVSSQLGVGSCFTLSLPALDLQPRLEPRPPAAISGAEESAESLEGLAALRGLRVWLVEDDALVRLSTQRLLESFGLQLRAFADLASFAAAWSAEPRPQLVLSDFRLPQARSALDVLRLVRMSEPDLPLVIFSGESGPLVEPSEQSELANLLVLRKPVAPRDLLQALLDQRVQAPD